MAQPREHLERAPIVEALVDIRVQPREGLSAAGFETLAQSLTAEYPSQAEMFAFQAQFGVIAGQTVAPQPTQVAVGWTVRSTDAGAVAQFRLDGFTFNKLRPYSSWEEVSGKALALWTRYTAVARPIEVSRIAVRYINRLELPAGDLTRYLTAPPLVPAPMPQNLREYLTRVTVWDAARSASAVITHALGAPLAPDRLQVLLDIDVFREGAFPVDTGGLAEILQPLRALKNEIFFANLTEAAVELYT